MFDLSLRLIAFHKSCCHWFWCAFDTCVKGKKKMLSDNIQSPAVCSSGGRPGTFGVSPLLVPLLTTKMSVTDSNFLLKKYLFLLG